MLAVVPFGVCLAAIIFLREIPESATSVAAEKEESRYFAIFNTLAVVVAVYLLTYDLNGSKNQFLSLVFTIILLILLASPLAVLIYAFLKSWSLVEFEPDTEKQEPLLKQEINATEPEKNEVNNTEVIEGEVVAMVEKRRPVIGEDHNIAETMQTWDFWLLFVSFLCCVGTGMAVINNMAHIGLALGHADVG